MKGFLLRFFGILVVASAAGITHSVIAGPIKTELAPLPEGAGNIVIPQGKGDPGSPTEPQGSEPTEPEGSAGVTNPQNLVLEREITLEQARLLFEHSLADFIDARTKDKYELGHIPGAFNVPPDAFTRGTPPVVDFLDVERPVVVYCTGGDCHDSHVVIEQMMLIRPELVRLHVFTDGYPAWTGAGLPTDTSPDPLAE